MPTPTSSPRIEPPGQTPAIEPSVPEAEQQSESAGATVASSLRRRVALRRTDVVAMQQVAGNRATRSTIQAKDQSPKPFVTGQIQKDGAPQKEATSADDFNVTGGVPVGQGPVAITPKGSDGVQAESPDIRFPAEVSVKDGRTLPSAYLGYIQNLVSSDRVGVYRRGGDPKGEITSEQHTAVKDRWDAVLDPDAADKGQNKLHKGVFAPWYWEPHPISDANTSGNPLKLTAEHDRPVAIFDKKVGDGQLTEIKGSDNFKLGLAVRKANTDITIMLKASEWSVKWDGSVDSSGKGSGAGASSKVLNDPSKGPDPNLKKWSFEKGDSFEGFSTVEDAKKRTPAELLQSIFKAQMHDQTSYRNICAALDEKNPTVTGTITCVATDANFTDDVVSATLLRDNALLKTKGGMHLNNGNTNTISVPFLDAFGSAAKLTAATKLKLEIYVGGQSTQGQIEAQSPFSKTETLKVETGKYTLEIELK